MDASKTNTLFCIYTLHYNRIRYQEKYAAKQHAPPMDPLRLTDRAFDDTLVSNSIHYGGKTC